MSDEQYPSYYLADQLDRLAPSAQAKYRRLVAEQDEVRARLKLTLEQEADLDTRRAVVVAHLQSRDPAMAENAGTIQRRTAQLEQIDRELAVLQAKRAKLNMVHMNVGQTLTMLQGFIGAHYGAAAAPPVTATANNGESLTDALDRTRNAIADRQSELIALKSALWPEAELRAWAAAEVARLGASGCARILFADDGRPSIDSPDAPQFAAAGQPLSAPSGSAFRMLCRLFPREALRDLEEQIDGLVAAGILEGAVPQAERPARIAALQQEIEDLERVEESFLEQAQAAGADVSRRPDQSPFAILGLRSRLAASELPVAAE
jgi:hypothetical protein